MGQVHTLGLGCQELSNGKPCSAKDVWEKNDYQGLGCLTMQGEMIANHLLFLLWKKKMGGGSTTHHSLVSHLSCHRDAW